MKNIKSFKDFILENHKSDKKDTSIPIEIEEETEKDEDSEENEED